MIDGLRDLPYYQIAVYSLATVLPLMYVEVILVQFCLSTYMMKMQTDTLCEILNAVCRAEVVLAPYELGQY